MKRLPLFILSVFLPIVLSGCFEIKEKLKITKSGSGNYQLLMDFSQSKKIFQVMMEMASKGDGAIGGVVMDDPLGGLDSAFIELGKELSNIKGISQVEGIKDENNYVFGIKLNYENVEALNRALSKMDSGNDIGYFQSFYSFSKGKLDKSNSFNLSNLIEEIYPDEEENENEEMNQELINMFEEVKYSLEISTDGKIRRFSNDDAVLSDDKKFLVYSKSLKELKEGIGNNSVNKDFSLSNSIKFK
ncbi:hypothetical protein [Flexithrix dorotheae]|uniref:hypothetical protein n=1 Tax=Flexithrix dorotheae TaxID=70993 RepID=UPI00036C59B3|nr:hypothetical protein [Flexithrix dorotheae]